MQSYPAWEAGNKNIPGIYIEFKEPWLNPKGFEQIVYDVLANTQDMNIIEKPVTRGHAFLYQQRDD